VLNAGLVFPRAPGDEAIRPSDPARRRRCGPRPHQARTPPRRTDAVRHRGDRQTQLHGGGRLIVTCTATTASHATDSSRDPQSLAAQNIPFRHDPPGHPRHGSAVHNGNVRFARVEDYSQCVSRSGGAASSQIGDSAARSAISGASGADQPVPSSPGLARRSASVRRSSEKRCPLHRHWVRNPVWWSRKDRGRCRAMGEDRPLRHRVLQHHVNLR
jgi:hypothetical protein